MNTLGWMAAALLFLCLFPPTALRDYMRWLHKRVTLSSPTKEDGE